MTKEKIEGEIFMDENGDLTKRAIVATAETEGATPEPEKLRMQAYYYGFDETGIIEIDRVLSAVATAGKMYHGTQEWGGGRYNRDDQIQSELIQKSANECAKAYDANQSEIEFQQERIHTQQRMMVAQLKTIDRLRGTLEKLKPEKELGG